MARIYPGDGSTVKELAEYCAAVASDRGLPPILPVMASVPELTSAWTSEGHLHDIPGYLWPVDACSVGLWQQQADDLGCGEFGWGTRDQLIRVPFGLMRFCDVALEMADGYPERHHKQEHPGILGEWIADVQRPYEAYRHRYETIGYPIAAPLIPTIQPDEWPQTRFEVLEDGWLWIPELGKYLRGPADFAFNTDSSGWAYGTTSQNPPAQWTWPTDVQPVGYLGDGSYIDQHPTRWQWVPKVEKLARYIVDYYEGAVTVNTYVDHPPGWWRDTTSFDLWGPRGRGDAIDPATAKEIVDWQLGDDNEPWIDWLIWNEWMWTASAGWQWFSADSSPVDNGHYRHAHFTFKE